MKKYIYMIGIVALTLTLSGLPSAAFAADMMSGDTSGGATMDAQMSAQGQGTDASTSMSVQMGGGDRRPTPGQDKKQEHQSEAASSSEHSSEQASSSEHASEAAQQMSEKVREMLGEHFYFNLESTTTQAFSLAQLQQMIDTRKQELDQEDASTTLADKTIVKNANEVRLAVHALLAAKPLLGGIGQQVSQIAQQVDASVATTTNAEAQIQARSFFAKLFFGGDSAAAQVIKDQAVQNQQHIQDLTQLLAQAQISAAVQATLKTQIAAMELQQTNLVTLAQKEQSMWGLFSWRF